MRSAHVWTDGCRSGQALDTGRLAPGGWAAVVESGTDGWVLRGRDVATTNTRMELVAMVEGLASLPDRASVNGIPAVLHTDCTIALHVRDAWLHGLSKRNAGKAKDGDLWLRLIEQFERLDVGIDLIGKRDRVSQHRRAHLISREEAVAAGGEVALARPPSAKQRRNGLRPRGLYRHPKACTPSCCVYWCPVQMIVVSGDR